MFGRWNLSYNHESHGSFGNGTAMRISQVGFIAHTDYEVCELSEIKSGKSKILTK